MLTSNLTQNDNFRFPLIWTIAFILIFESCQNLSVQEDVVARVADQYLYRSELADFLGENYTPLDSVQKVNSFINNWALKRILIDQAKLNLSASDEALLRKLIQNYEYDLFNAAYQKKVLNANLDTLIVQREIDSFYAREKNLFILNQSFYQIRYLVVPFDNVQINAIRRRFKEYKTEDIAFLDSLSFQFTRHSFNDSLWINKRILTEKLPFLDNENLKLYLKKGVNFEVDEALDLYLFRFNDFKDSGDTAPMDRVKSTIENIIKNQRKQNFIKKFEKELLQDAIQTKKYETY